MVKKTLLLLIVCCITSGLCAQSSPGPWLQPAFEKVIHGKKVTYHLSGDYRNCYLLITDLALNRCDTVFSGGKTAPFWDCWIISDVLFDSVTNTIAIYYKKYKVFNFYYAIAFYKCKPESNKYDFIKEKEIDFWEDSSSRVVNPTAEWLRIDDTTYYYIRKDIQIDYFGQNRIKAYRKLRVHIDFDLCEISKETTDFYNVCFEKHFDMMRLEQLCSITDVPNYLVVNQLELNRADTVFYTRENGPRQGLAPYPWYIEDAFIDKESKSLVVFYNKFSEGTRYLTLALFRLQPGIRRYELIKSTDIESWKSEFDYIESLIRKEIKMVETDRGNYAYTRVGKYGNLLDGPVSSIEKSIQIDFVNNQISIENKTK